MTVVLQHRFWDLGVSDERFEVKLTFDGIPERLSIPFAAIKVFFDPSVPYGLQFEDSDLAGQTLAEIRTAALLIVGGADYGVIELNKEALAHLKGPKALQIVPGASHLFPEPGALEAVIEYAARWFARHLGGTTPRAGGPSRGR